MDIQYKFYYTYRITNIIKREYYFGVHCSNRPPEQEMGNYYFSSSSDIEFIRDQKENPQNYSYKILSIFPSKEEAQAHEIKICERLDVKSHPKFINKCNPTFNGFIHDGRISCYDSRDINKLKLVVSTEMFRNSDNLISVHKGRKFSESSKEKMRNPKSQIGRENITKSNRENKRFGEDNHFYGKKHTCESKEKIVNNRRKNHNGDYHPNGNRTAKRFKFTNPEGEEFVVFNGSREFGMLHNIDVRKFEKLKEGEAFYIKQLRKDTPQLTINTQGWSRITI